MIAKSVMRRASCVMRHTILIFAACAILPLSANAQEGAVKQFQSQFKIGGKIPAAIVIVGYAKDSAEIGKLLTVIAGRADEVFARLDWQNPASEVSKINEQAGQGPVQVSSEVVAAFSAAEKLSTWTDGLFDVTFAGQGNWKNIKIKKDNSTVELKKSGMQARFDRITDGFLAEFISRCIQAGGMQNALIKVGGAFRGMGTGQDGQWKVEVQDAAGAFAHRAVELTIGNAGIATASAAAFKDGMIINPKTKKEVAAPCKGVIVAMKDATFAAGISSAALILAPDEAMKLITKFGRGIILDKDGNFIRSPGF